MQFPPKSPRDLAYLALCVLFFGGIFAFYTMVYSPKEAELAAVQSHIGQLEQNNQRAKAELAKGSVNDLRAQALRYQQNLQLMRQLVPTTNEVPALIEQVSTAARRVNLELNGINPEPPISGDQFDTYRYQISVVGDYHAIAAFLTNVGSLTRIVAPVNLQLAPVVQNGGAGLSAASRNKAVLSSKFEIQTYVAKGAGAAADQPVHGHAPKPGA
ncbi:MAG TPA: type 4a pilus biogenesis protein PilO [Gemmatimonadaceae bacterium]|nr:type 4a pilus biogenesis protein PilO [Gemmatimonadaceae bacterium]